MLGYSGVAQAGYMLSGVVVGTSLGVQATVLYLFAYLAMNLAPFAVIVAVERERPEFGDDIAGLSGLGARDPWLAWPMTIGMLALAGIPGTVGFIGKFQLIHALVDGSYTWLAIVLVIGSMISLGYYLRVVAAIWMRPAVTTRPVIAGGSQEAVEPVRTLQFEVAYVALAFSAAVIVFGIIPSPLFHFAEHAGRSIGGLF
jgi:NADH-quinone oxidoreductase subunit N